MPTLGNYSFVVGDPNPRPIGAGDVARGSVVWNGTYYGIDVRTMSERADTMNRVNVLGVVTSRREATNEERSRPRMSIMPVSGGQPDNYAIASVQINANMGYTMIEVQGVRDMAFRRTGETVEQMNERGLDALRELVEAVSPIAEKHLPDREPNLMESWRD